MRQVKWLVEIRPKDYVAIPEGLSPVIHFEEVIAVSEVGARFAAIDLFFEKIKTDCALQETLQKYKMDLSQCCAPSAIQI